MKKSFILKDLIKKEKQIIIASLSIGLILTTLISLYTKNYSDKIQSNLSDKVIRLHILANSNNDIDQNLKLEVRDKILEKYSGDLENQKDIASTRNFINNNMKDIEIYVNDFIKSKDMNYTAKASLGATVFPTKHYANISFPAGEYEALKIEIGKAEGENWWCVMFPPLCFVDITQGESQVKKDNTDKLLAREKPLALKENSVNTFNFGMKTETVYANSFVTDDEEIIPEIKQEKTESETEIETELESESKSEIKKPKEKTNQGKLTEKSNEILKTNLDTETYDIVTNDIKVKFKIVEFWQNLKHNNIFAKK